MAAAAFTTLFGDKLLQGKTEVATSEALKDKPQVAIYFSAHWCPPCRGFTPELAKAYTDHLKAKGLEIVFVSSDKEQSAFDDYFAEMPWLALPYSERDLKNKLSKKYKVQGIPTLVLLDGATGELVTKEGRNNIAEDPKGANFPWIPPTFWDALGTEFLSGPDGDTVEVDELKGKGKVIGLYFSAHWCPPCRGFTPELVKAYTDHLKAKGLEIIFVSSDRDAKSFMEYYATMPWLAIPQGDKRKDALSKLFGVQGIPTLALVDAETGQTINANARGKVSADPTGAEFPYRPKPLNDMVAEGPGDINEEATLCLMLEGCDAASSASALAALEPIAAEFKEKGEEIGFLYARKSGGPTSQIRELSKLGEPSKAAQMVLFDIPDNGGYYVAPACTGSEGDWIQTFLSQYKAGGLERKQLG